MPHKIGREIEQLLIMPANLDDYVSEDNPVRVIKEFVDSLDFEQLKFKKARSNEKSC